MCPRLRLGAGVATSLALVSNTTMQMMLGAATTNPDDAEALTASVVAPVVEETLKGIGVVIVMLARRRSVTSPLDGVVIAGLVGAGFAFTENILYFLNAGDEILVVFILRAILSPFCHSMFTSLIGLAMAIALTRLRRRRAWMGTVPVGWASAVVLHSLWNGLASFTEGSFVRSYVLFWLPFFFGWFLIISLSAAKQRRWIRAGLQAFAEAGWLHPGEVEMVTSLTWRRFAKRRARAVSRRAARAMRDFQHAAARLGLTYVASVRLGSSPERAEMTRSELSALVAARSVVAAERGEHA
ncbi:PrsW family intramembrane metalloprotease [Nanchangia anserum]|nr:PrsW family intramembrane metalloprotease [Nanchangia anserum]